MSIKFGSKDVTLSNLPKGSEIRFYESKRLGPYIYFYVKERMSKTAFRSWYRKYGRRYKKVGFDKKTVAIFSGNSAKLNTFFLYRVRRGIVWPSCGFGYRKMSKAEWNRTLTKVRKWGKFKEINLKWYKYTFRKA